MLNLPGWRWARIKQLALVGSSSSLHSEACKALGGSDGVVHSRISGSGDCVRADANKNIKFLENYKIYSNPVSANFLFLDFEKCKYSAKYLYEKLKNKGIILRSTRDGYHINNKLRLTIGSKKENLKFLSALKEVLN